MIKVRTKQQFKDSIASVRRVFGTEDNSVTRITHRAVRWFNSNPRPIPKINGIGVGSPVLIFKNETKYSENDIQSITVMYSDDQISKSKSRIYPKWNGDDTVDFRMSE
jgi:hypothetical protein